jgi:hypothetical protein
MIKPEYLEDEDLCKGAMVVESCANGRSDEGFLGEAASSRKDGSFSKDILTPQAFDRFLADGYIEPVSDCPGWYRKA